MIQNLTVKEKKKKQHNLFLHMTIIYHAVSSNISCDQFSIFLRFDLQLILTRTPPHLTNIVAIFSVFPSRIFGTSFGILVLPDGHTTGESFVYIFKPSALFHSPTYISKKRFLVCLLLMMLYFRCRVFIKILVTKGPQ